MRSQRKEKRTLTLVTIYLLSFCLYGAAAVSIKLYFNHKIGRLPHKEGIELIDFTLFSVPSLKQLCINPITVLNIACILLKTYNN